MSQVPNEVTFDFKLPALAGQLHVQTASANAMKLINRLVRRMAVITFRWSAIKSRTTSAKCPAWAWFKPFLRR
ncbi:MAG: hypothetical protein ACTS4U_01755 [Candidatus Hodgkinia cicadicola]